jgi:uncharacterized protein (TIGR02231 family)
MTDLSIEYSLTDVTVYPDRAQVRCQGGVDVTPAVQTLVFDELPLTMDRDSVRAGGSGTAAVIILSVDVVQEHYEQSPAPAIQELETEIQTIQEEIQAIEDDLAVWQAEADLLAGLRGATQEYAKGLSRGRMSVEEQNDLILYIRHQDREIRQEQRSLASQARLLRRRLEKREKELSDLRSARGRSRYQVRITVDIKEEGHFVPVLTYVVRNAGWHPIYDLHYRTADRELSLSTYAQISQRTGQDWQDVQILVSTARPALNQRVPDLQPWFIDLYVTPPIPAPLHSATKMAGEKQMLMAEAAPPAGKALSERAVDAELAEAAVQGDEAVVTYRVAGTSTVASDAAAHKFFLARFSPEITLSYLSVPKHTDAVFRRIKAINNANAPLLSGQASLFFDDEFIGKTDLAYTPVGGEVELLLGIEERIKVTRELVKRFVDKRFLKDNRVIHYGYEIKLKNLLDETADIELKDQVPVSRHEEIQVKLDEAKPAPSEQSELNIMEWTLKLQPHAEMTVVYSYTVQHPRSMHVVGLLD